MRKKIANPVLRNDYTPTTAASSNKREDLQTADVMDMHIGLQ